MTDSIDALPEGLSFTDNISITWNTAEHRPDDAQLATLNESNESFLRTASAIGEFFTDVAEEDTATSQDIIRLDLKLNLILDLVGQLIYKQLDIPAMSLVTISSSEVAWQCTDVPEPGQMIFIEAYVQHGTPKPLCFYGEVVSDKQEHSCGHVRARYLGLNGSVQTWLDKLIFRHHRRAVAYKKAMDSENGNS